MELRTWRFKPAFSIWAWQEERLHHAASLCLRVGHSIPTAGAHHLRRRPRNLALQQQHWRATFGVLSFSFPRFAVSVIEQQQSYSSTRSTILVLASTRVLEQESSREKQSQTYRLMLSCAGWVWSSAANECVPTNLNLGLAITTIIHNY